MEFWSLVVQTVVSNAVAQLWSSNVYGRPKAKEWKNLCPTCYEWFVQVIFLKLTHWAMQRSSTPFPFTIQSKSKYLPSLMRISKYPVMNCNISFLDISTKTPTLKLPHAPSSPPPTQTLSFTCSEVLCCRLQLQLLVQGSMVDPLAKLFQIA